jgi:hypothetical protein
VIGCVPFPLDSKPPTWQENKKVKTYLENRLIKDPKSINQIVEAESNNHVTTFEADKEKNIIIVFRYYRNGDGEERSYQIAKTCAQAIHKLLGAQFTELTMNGTNKLFEENIVIYVADDSTMGMDDADLVFNFYANKGDNVKDEELTNDLLSHPNSIAVYTSNEDTSRILPDPKDTIDHSSELNPASGLGFTKRNGVVVKHTPIQISIGVKPCNLAGMRDQCGRLGFTDDNDEVVNQDVVRSLLRVINGYVNLHYNTLYEKGIITEDQRDKRINVLGEAFDKYKKSNWFSELIDKETIFMSLSALVVSSLMAQRISGTKRASGMRSSTFEEFMLLWKGGLKAATSLQSVCMTVIGSLSVSINRRRKSSSPISNWTFFSDFIKSAISNVTVQIFSIGLLFDVNSAKNGNPKQTIAGGHTKSYALAKQLKENEQKRTSQYKGTLEYKILYNLVRAPLDYAMSNQASLLYGPGSYTTYRFVADKVYEAIQVDNQTVTKQPTMIDELWIDPSADKRLEMIGESMFIVHRKYDEGMENGRI